MVRSISLIFIFLAVQAGAQSQALLVHNIDKISASFMGRPYLVDPLGEATGFDTDPLFRFDAFDCTTFVETVMALARTHQDSDFESQIIEIRYKNSWPSFVERNHFTDADWVPNNIRKGILRDVTRDVFATSATAHTHVDKAAWFKKVHSLESYEPGQNISLPYIPIRAILNQPAILNRIPSGAVINIVRPNWELKEKIGTNMNVSHQGFAIRKSSGELYFRHASQTYLQITEEPLLMYLNKMKEIPTIGGIHILTLRPLPSKR